MAATERVALGSVPSFRYAVEIEGIAVGWFTDCGGLTVERTVYPYEEGGLNAYVHQLPDRIKHTHITLKRGIADQMLWKWFAGENDEGLYESKVTYRNVTIVLYNVDRTESRRWNVERAYPTKWSGPDLRADSTQVAVETLEFAQGESAAASVEQRALETEEGGHLGEGLASQQQEPAEPEANLPALAKKVYDLLKQELRLERERLGWTRMR
jgi:phage tail-like protein